MALKLIIIIIIVADNELQNAKLIYIGWSQIILSGTKFESLSNRTEATRGSDPLPHDNNNNNYYGLVYKRLKEGTDIDNNFCLYH